MAMKTFLIIFTPLLAALAAVILIHKIQPQPSGSIIPVYIRVEKQACGNVECRKVCTQKGYGYHGYRLVSTGGLLGKKQYECFCLE